MNFVAYTSLHLQVDAIGGARGDDGGGGGDNEVQRTMLEIVNQVSNINVHSEN
jgi:ATP-dependent 26S proteasome regulatory subunit